MLAQQNEDSLRLPDHFEIAVKLIKELGSLGGNNPQYKEKQKEASEHLGIANRMVHDLKVFGDDEHFSEHSTASLGYLLIPCHQAELDSKSYPKVDDPERDEKRLLLLERAIGFYREFLTSCISIGLEKEEKVKPYLLDSEALDPRKSRESREAKVANMRALMTHEKNLKELETQINAANESKAPIDEDLERDHMLTTLQTWVLKSSAQIVSLQSEMGMLKQMQAHRQSSNSKDKHQEMQSQDGARAPQQQKPEPPMVITKDMVKQMATNNSSLHRKDFQLITKGYGPIGAPTMSLDQLADIEIADAMKRSANQKPEVEFDEDDEFLVDTATYQARDRDVVNDYVRRGDGNKMNMG